jgi:hypothetical protein
MSDFDARLKKLEREAGDVERLTDPLFLLRVARNVAAHKASVPALDGAQQEADEAAVAKLTYALATGDLTGLDLTSDVDELFPEIAPSPTPGQDLARRVHSLIT